MAYPKRGYAFLGHPGFCSGCQGTPVHCLALVASRAVLPGPIRLEPVEKNVLNRNRPKQLSLPVKEVYKFIITATA